MGAVWNLSFGVVIRGAVLTWWSDYARVFLICCIIQNFLRHTAQNWLQCSCRIELEFVTNSTHCAALNMKFKHILLTKTPLDNVGNFRMICRPQKNEICPHITQCNDWEKSPTGEQNWIMRLVCSLHQLMPSAAGTRCHEHPKFSPLVLFYAFGAFYSGLYCSETLDLFVKNYCQ